jgi:hypothetical protein
MSEESTNSYGGVGGIGGIGAPTVPNVAPADIPPPPAAAPLVSPRLPSLTAPAAPSFAPTLPGTAISTTSATPTTPAIATGMIATPTLPPAGMPPTVEPTDDSPPALANLGLPVGAPPSGPREVPEWKRRQNSKGRKLSKRLIQLAVLGALGGGAWFVYQSQLKLKDDTDVTTPDTAAIVEPGPDVVTDAPAKSGPVAIIDAAQDTVDAINDNGSENELIAELVPMMSGPFEPNPDAVITSGDIVGDGFVSAAKAQSWTYRWALPKDTMTMAVNANTGDFDANFVLGNDVRFVGGQFFESLDGGATWNVVDAGPEQLTVAGFAHSLPTFETALPTDIVDFVILSNSDDTGAGRFLIDDFALFEQNPAARTAWLTVWGIDTSIAPSPIVGFADEIADAAGPGQILVSITGSPDRIGTRLAVSTPTAGGTSTYFLVDTSDTPRVILAPPVG